MRIAIFDFDGTLYADETFQLLMSHLKNHPVHHPRYKKFHRNILLPYISYKMKLLPEAKMKERSMKIYLDALEKLTKSELDAYFEGMTEKIQAGYNREVITRLQQHIDDNVHVMLVSGAYTPLLQTVTKELNFDRIIGTDIPLQDEKIDFRTPLYHIQGPRKNEKIKEALQGKDIDWANSYAYGDSFSDLPVLELVGNPVAVHPEARLKAIAKERKWEIL